jgi:hypothetical protein
MTRPDEPIEGSDDRGTEADDDAMSALLKRSLGAAKPEPRAPDEFLRGVQKRIRARSRGKFYGDGWSTAAPRVSYALIALVMLLVMALAYVVLGPTGISAP